jgi:hypothetical protein
LTSLLNLTDFKAAVAAVDEARTVLVQAMLVLESLSGL